MNPIQNIYKPIYDEMRERNQDLIIQNGTKYDEVLSSSDKDERVGLALFATTEFHLNNNFENMLAETKTVFDSQIIYQQTEDTQRNHGFLHFTFIQFIGVDPLIKTITKKKLEEYKGVLSRVIQTIKPFSIQYQGLIALATGLVMYGYPSVDINIYREQIRQKIVESKLPFKEPFKIDIAHSTFVRFCQPEDKDKLLEFASKYQSIDLGKVNITGFYLGNGSWRMRPDEVTRIYEFNILK